MADVLCIGELNPDLVLSGIRADAPRLGIEQEFGDYLLTLGSSTAIACVLMQRLGLATAMSAYVGDDDYGRFCLARLIEEGVDVALVRVHDALPTGITVCLPYPSDRMLLTCKGTMTLNPADVVDDDVLRGVRHVHVGSFSCRMSCGRRWRGVCAGEGAGGDDVAGYGVGSGGAVDG